MIRKKNVQSFLVSRKSPPLRLIVLALTVLMFLYQQDTLDYSLPGWSLPHERNCTSSCRCDRLHGSCLIDRCICDAGYGGEDCSVPSWRPNIRCLVDAKDDVCMNTERYGRLKVASTQRQKEAQSCETDFWQTHASPTRNQDQMLAFESFRSLPLDLGDVVEVGAGPYTKLRLILDASSKWRRVKSVTLIDPLLNDYILHPNVTTSYPNGTLCNAAGFCVPTKLLSTTGETPLPCSHYDTAILINTLEHCENAVAVLDNIHRSLKINGILIFGESFATDWQLRGNDKCHPIQPTRILFDEFLAQFSSSYLLEPRTGQLDGIMNGGARQSIYAIARKASSLAE